MLNKINKTNLQVIGTAVKYGCWNCIGNGDGVGYENVVNGYAAIGIPVFGSATAERFCC